MDKSQTLADLYKEIVIQYSVLQDPNSGTHATLAAANRIREITPAAETVVLELT